MDCAQKGISAWRHSVHHWGDQPSSDLFWWQRQWNRGFLGICDSCHWVQQSYGLVAEGMRLMGMRGEQQRWEGISWLGRLKQPEGGGQSTSLPALSNLGCQKRRSVWVAQGVGLTSAKGSPAEGQQYLRNQQSCSWPWHSVCPAGARNRLHFLPY